MNLSGIHINGHKLKPHHVLLMNNFIAKGNDGENYIRSTINDSENFPQYEEIAAVDR